MAEGWWRRFEFETVQICLPAAKDGNHKAAEQVLHYFYQCWKTGKPVHPAVFEYLANAFVKALESGTPPTGSIVGALNLKRPKHRTAANAERNYRIFKEIKKLTKSGKTVEEAAAEVADDAIDSDNVIKIYNRINKLFLGQK